MGAESRVVYYGLAEEVRALRVGEDEGFVELRGCGEVKGSAGEAEGAEVAEGVLGWRCADKVDDAGAYFWGGHFPPWGVRGCIVDDLA